MTRGITLPVLLALFITAGCGRKGPPLPPLNRIPAAPADFAAERRAGQVTLQFTVPAANTDGTRPANIERVEVYALTSPVMVPTEQLIKMGKPIATVAVKAPRDPDAVIEPGDADEDMEPPSGIGLDQGVSASVSEELPATAGAAAAEEPLLRIYVGVGVARNGRKGLMSTAVAVPLVPAPPAPPAPTVSYSEKQISLTWAATAAPGAAYNVYEIPVKTAAVDPEKTPKPLESRLTPSPIAAVSYDDARMEWGAERCYVVRTVATIDGRTVESEASPRACVTLADNFPPATPGGFETGPSQGAISLVWDPNKEPDLAGYVVLRGEPSAPVLTPITPTPIQETGYEDKVPAGSRYAYAIQAVDKSGNVSAPTVRKEETAR